MDGIRAVAILSVFLHHALHAKLLWMGVDLFFVLSGFLITGILLDAKPQPLARFFAHFYSRRARRILPPYLLLLALASCVFGVAWMRHWYLYFFLANLFKPLRIEPTLGFGPLWSLAVEEQFYLVWPFAVYFLDNRRLRQFCIFLMLAAPILRGSLHFEEYWPIYNLTPFRMDLLAAGSLLCLEWRSRRDQVERHGTALGLSIASIGLAGLLTLMKLGYSTYGNTRIGNVLIYEACLFIALGTIIFALAGRGVQLLRSKPLTYIGQISYSMYLIHRLVLVIVSQKFPPVPAAAIAFAITVAYAAVSWHFLESRLLLRKHEALPYEATPENASTALSKLSAVNGFSRNAQE